VAEASSGEKALAMVEAQEPDIILMDLNMKGMDSIQTTEALRSRGVVTCILMVKYPPLRRNPTCTLCLPGLLESFADGRSRAVQE
jgi:CheY-like chemotaxis protein